MAHPHFSSAWMTDEHRMLRDSVHRFMADRLEYRIAGLCADPRVQRIDDGTNEIMKEPASRFL